MRRPWLLVAVAAAAGCRERVDPPASHTGHTAPAAAPSRPLYGSARDSFVDLIASAKHGVVAIRAAAPVKSGPAAMFPGAPESTADVALGTGFLIESNGVFVLTNDHIAATVTDLRIVLAGGVEAPAKLVGRDTRLDIALLSIERGDAAALPRLRGLPLGDSDTLAVGEWLVVLGNAFGDEVSAAAGIVSATGREAAASIVPKRAIGVRTFLQTDARIHRGNSGGPVLNTAGQVIGVATATGDRPEELSFVIPISRVKEALEPLRDHGSVARAWLGVLAKPVPAELAQQLGLPKPSGALVTEVMKDSPAARAALRVGDVILKWAGREVDHRSLPWVIAQAPIGQSITLTIWRNRAEFTVPLVTDRMRE